MTAAELKASILDRAVRGELTAAWRTEREAKGEVERRETRDARGRETRDTPPSDVSRLTSSPAVSSLASRVSRPTPGPTPIADPPYDLPQGWVWKRLEDICDILDSQRKPITKTDRKQGPYPYYGASCVQDYVADYIFDEPLVLVGEDGAKWGAGDSTAYYIEGKSWVNNHAHVLRIGQEALPRWIVIFLTGSDLHPFVSGTTVPKLNQAKLRTIPIPLPPLAEQKRIVAKIEELMPLVEEYGKAETELAALNDNFPTALRKSILQHAVEGRLTATWREAHGLASPSVSRPLASPVSRLASKTPSPAAPPETAADLLAKIAAEKKSLLAAGKIKKSKPLPPITDDEKPFAIPETWAWVRLGEIGTWGSGATPSKSNNAYYKSGTIPWLVTGDLNDGDITEIPGLITPLALEETSVKLNQPESVLIAMYGATIGKVGILKKAATTNQACCACQPFSGIYNKYLFYYLMSQRDAFQKRGEGGAQPNISKEKIVATAFPLPPLAEQKAIVARVEELLKLVEEMKE